MQLFAFFIGEGVNMFLKVLTKLIVCVKRKNNTFILFKNRHERPPVMNNAYFIKFIYKDMFYNWRAL